MQARAGAGALPSSGLSIGNLVICLGRDFLGSELVDLSLLKVASLMGRAPCLKRDVSGGWSEDLSLLGGSSAVRRATGLRRTGDSSLLYGSSAVRRATGLRRTGSLRASGRAAPAADRNGSFGSTFAVSSSD